MIVAAKVGIADPRDRRGRGERLLGNMALDSS
jgi:hypothetical protein